MIDLSSFRLSHSDPHGEVIFEAVREGLTPFKAEAIHLYMERDLDFNRFRLIIEVRFKGPWDIQHLEIIDADDLYSDPDLEIAKLYPKIVHAFRNREDYFDLAPLIYLGNN